MKIIQEYEDDTCPNQCSEDTCPDQYNAIYFFVIKLKNMQFTLAFCYEHAELFKKIMGEKD